MLHSSERLPPSDQCSFAAMVRRVRALVLYLLSVVVLAVGTVMVWWMFVVLVLNGAGCDGPCNAVGEFTQDYWWLIALGGAVPIAFLLLPLYRRGHF
jgi:hypothetical protein